MKTLRQIFNDWLNTQNKIEAEIEKLKTKNITTDFSKHLKEKFGDDYPNFWSDKIITPIVEQIKTAGNFERVDVIGPCGIGSQVFLECFTNDHDQKHIKGITVTPNLEEEGASPLFIVDHSTNNQEFAKNTIGAINGMNNPKKPINPETCGEQWLAILNNA
jgi:hypothetical protein